MATKAKQYYMHKSGEYITVGDRDIEPFKVQGWAIVPFKENVEHNKDGKVVRRWQTQDITSLKPQGVKEVSGEGEEGDNIHSLMDFVDDRSLPDLESMGVTNIQQFIDADQEAIIKGVKFITAKAYDQIRLKIINA